MTLFSYPIVLRWLSFSGGFRSVDTLYIYIVETHSRLGRSGSAFPAPLRHRHPVADPFISLYCRARRFLCGGIYPYRPRPRHQIPPATRRPGPRPYIAPRHQPATRTQCTRPAMTTQARTRRRFAASIYLYCNCEFYAMQRLDLQFYVLLLLLLSIGPAAGRDPAGPAKIFFTAI